MDVIFHAIEEYVCGRADFPSLQRRITEIVSESPGAAIEVLDAIHAALQTRRLTPEEHFALTSAIEPYADESRRQNTSSPAEATKLRSREAFAARTPTGGPTLYRNEGPAAAPTQAQMARPEDSVLGPRTGADSNWERPQDWKGVSDAPVEEGTVLKEHYLLEERIGEGGMGVVFRAKDIDAQQVAQEQQFVAVKVLKPDFRQHPDALKALYEEVRKSRTLAHPNIVSVYTFERDGAVVYMTMEYLEGKSLDALLDEDYARGMPFAQAWQVIEGAGRALAYAHDRGIVHSDLKPSNVFVTTSGRAKVLDFGIARAARRGTRKHYDPGELKALTFAYASPEMLRDEPPDPRDDVYALGCVAYEVLTGRHPFGGRSADQLQATGAKPAPISALNRRQNGALAAALAFDREARTSKIEEFLAALQGSGAFAVAPRMLAYAGIATIVLSLAGGAMWWWLGSTDENEQLLESLYQPNAKASEEADPETVQVLLEQGNDYLQMARQRYDPGVLSKGVSSSYGAFVSVLRLDPSSREAALGIVEVFKIYREQAHKFNEERQYGRALEAAKYGLEINAESADLKELRDELSGRVQPTQ